MFSLYLYFVAYYYKLAKLWNKISPAISSMKVAFAVLSFEINRGFTDQEQKAAEIFRVNNYKW